MQPKYYTAIVQFQSAEFFELAPKEAEENTKELTAQSEQTQHSITSLRSSRIGLASNNQSTNINNSYLSDSSKVVYPLTQHSYVTSQPPWVNKFKIRKAREHVSQIMTHNKHHSSPGYSFSPVPPPSNSAVPPKDDEDDDADAELAKLDDEETK